MNELINLFAVKSRDRAFLLQRAYQGLGGAGVTVRLQAPDFIG